MAAKLSPLSTSLYCSLYVLTSAAARAKKVEEQKRATHPLFTSSLPNGSEKETVFTAMANILVNSNLGGVWEMEGRRAAGGEEERRECYGISEHQRYKTQTLEYPQDSRTGFWKYCSVCRFWLLQQETLIKLQHASRRNPQIQQQQQQRQQQQSLGLLLTLRHDTATANSLTLCSPAASALSNAVVIRVALIGVQ
ncbi:uncharacterized protein V6R79_008777 [Siganus canaliculatus]